MSIYPCNFNEAWSPLIAPSKPNIYNKQTNEVKKVMSQSNHYSQLSNEIPKPNNPNLYNNNDINIEDTGKYIRGGNYINKNINITNNNEILERIENCEKYMKQIIHMLNTNKIEQLDTDYINKNKMNEILIYVSIAIIVSYIVFKITNKN
jgi:hypothetical protein